MIISFSCKACEDGKLEIEDRIENNNKKFSCANCGTAYVLEIQSTYEHKQLYKAAERGGYVKEKGEIAHTCPSCNLTFHA